MGNYKNRKLGVLFTGGKDSCLALFLAKKIGYEISCLISIESENKESYMFHTPSISEVKKQAKVLGIPLIMRKTKGKKEKELRDLEKAIRVAIKKFKIHGIVTGAVESVYQASRIQSICNKLNIECFNPLWQKDQFELLEDILKYKFEVILTGIFAYPFKKEWLGRKIDKEFIKEMKNLNKRYQINPAGEGGEFESFVLHCPLFKRRLRIVSQSISGEANSFRMEVVVE